MDLFLVMMSYSRLRQLKSIYSFYSEIVLFIAMIVLIF